MGVLDFLRGVRNPSYASSIKQVGTYGHFLTIRPGKYPQVEKSDGMERTLHVGLKPSFNTMKHLQKKTNQNLLITGATGQGKSKLMRLMLEMMPNPKTVFSFKERDEYLQIAGNMIYAERSLPDAFADPDAFTSAFAVAFNVVSEGIQANIAISLVRSIASKSKSWKDFIQNAKKMEKGGDNNTRAAAAYVLQKAQSLIYNPNQIELDLNKTNILDFSMLNEEAKTFYAELFLRQLYKAIRRRKPSETKVIACVDEAHRLTKNVSSRYASVFGEMSREIRAFGMLWTATQNLTDLPDTIRNQFGTQFCFNTTSEDDMRALASVNRDLARCASSLREHEFIDAKSPKIHDEIGIYKADVSILKERSLPERLQLEAITRRASSKAAITPFPPPEDRPTATQHAALLALYNNQSASLSELAKYLKTKGWVTGDPTIYGAKGRLGIFESLAKLGLAEPAGKSYKLKEAGLRWVDANKILENARNTGSDLHLRLIKATIKKLHESNILMLAPKEKEAPDLIGYPVASEAKKKYLWDDKDRKAYEIQTSARKENIAANRARNEKTGMKTVWATYNDAVLDEIKKQTENKDTYLIVKV